MIRSFRHKALSDLWATARSSKIDARLQRRILLRLDALDQAIKPTDMDIPGFDLHALKGFDPMRYTIHVNGPWCITFECGGGDVWRVDLEQYH